MGGTTRRVYLARIVGEIPTALIWCGGWGVADSLCGATAGQSLAGGGGVRIAEPGDTGKLLTMNKSTTSVFHGNK